MLGRPSQDRPYYVPLHSALPLFVLFLIFGLIILIFVSVILLAHFTFPSPSIVKTSDFVPSSCDIFPKSDSMHNNLSSVCWINLTYPLISSGSESGGVEESLTSLHSFALFYFSFRVKDGMFSRSPPRRRSGSGGLRLERISIPVMFESVLVEAYDTDIGDWKLITSTPWRNQERSIKCFSDRSSENMKCESILVFHEVYIRSKRYRIRMRVGGGSAGNHSGVVSDGQSEFDREIFENGGSWTVVLGNPTFAAAQSAYNAVFGVLGVVVWFVYFIVLCTKQGWRSSSVEQKIVAILVASLLLYNNPLFAFKYLGINAVVAQVFGMMNIIFKVFFFASVLFALLVFGHSLYATRAEKKSFAAFYATKLAVCTGIFIVATVTLCFASMHEGEGSVSYLRSSVYFFPMLRWGAGLLFLAYACIMLYYVARTCSKCVELCRESRNMCVIYAVTIIQVFVAVVVYFVLSQLNVSRSVYPITFSFVFNGYVVFLALLFLPSWKLDESIPEVAFSRLETEDDDDHL